jgi:hypothetical protein
VQQDGVVTSPASPFVEYVTEVAKGSMELVNDATTIVQEILAYPVIA